MLVLVLVLFVVEVVDGVVVVVVLVVDGDIVVVVIDGVVVVD